mmetsp:Transcript_22083/g.38892  ORF Transcript_22083/g.38892 Transcript_22083/m.38892 type:complete len:193 (+) Transcript_22083:43-621(+)
MLACPLRTASMSRMAWQTLGRLHLGGRPAWRSRVGELQPCCIGARCTPRRHAASDAQEAAAETLRSTLSRRREQLAGSVVPGGFSPASRVASLEESAAEANERLAGEQMRRAVCGSLIGLYPVYDIPRMVEGNFTGTKVVAPAALRYAIAEAAVRAPRVGGDGRVLTASQLDDDAADGDEELVDGEEYDEDS